MKKMFFACFMLAFSWVANATIIDFEGVAPAGGTTSLGSHTEDGFILNLTHGHNISSTFNASGYNNHSVQNGTDWLMMDTNGSNVLTALDNSLFSINSVDLMSYSSVDGIGAIIGKFADNTTIQTAVNYTTTLSTYTFSSAWSGLKSVNFSGSFFHKAIDNIVVNESISVPEPASIALLGLGLVGLSCARKKKSV